MRDTPHILIVHGSKDICERYRPIVEGEGFSVHIAETGPDALQVVSKVGCDLMVIDVPASPEAVFDLVKKAAQLEPGIVTIAVSPDLRQGKGEEGIADGVYEYVSEPFTPGRLMAAVNRGLEFRRAKVRAGELAAVFDSVAEGIFVVDGEFRLILWNPAGVRMLGVDEHVGVGKRIEEALAHPQLVGAIRRALSTDMSSCVAISEEIEAGTEGGPALMATISPYKDRGGVESGVVCTLREVRASGGQDHVKSQFVSMVTHELRAPLAAVEGYLTAYLTGAVGNDPKINRQMLERARQRTHSLLDLVSDLLQYSRLDSRRVERKRELLNIGEVIESTVELMKTHDESKELKFRTHMQESLPLIEANRLEMEQLFTNLISNAIKYNVKKGLVEISAGVKDDFVEVKVSDTGIGIDKEDLPCIFDEFFRVSGPQTRYTTGTGLGLSIVKKIVEAHFGRIEVESEVDKGTTFTVELPLGAGRHHEAGEDNAHRGAANTVRVCG